MNCQHNKSEFFEVVDCKDCTIAALRAQLEEARIAKKRDLAFLEAQNKSLMEHITTVEQYKMPSYTLNPQLLARAEKAEAEVEALRAALERIAKQAIGYEDGWCGDIAQEALK